jgi:hypothetical protein
MKENIKRLLGNCLRKKKQSVFERNAADFAAIMGFTAKNLTKLQPKTHVFSTDYKSQTGSKRLFYFFLTCVALSACGKTTQIRDYYFPLRALQAEPKVYAYKFSTVDTSFNMYWYYQTIQQNDSVWFVGTLYDQNYEQTQMTKELLQPDGMLLKDLIIHRTDIQGKLQTLQTRVRGGAVFPFEVTDSLGVFVNVIQFSEPNGRETTLTRNRRFIRKADYDFKGEKRKAVLFRMTEEQAEQDPQKGGFQHIFQVDEVYVENFGLVYSKRHITPTSFLECKLEEVYSMAAFEARFAQFQKLNVLK